MTTTAPARAVSDMTDDQTAVTVDEVQRLTLDLQRGIDTPLAVLTMLRGRRYDVREFAWDGQRSSALDRVVVAVALPADRIDLLVARLERFPSVMAVRRAA